MKDFDLKDRKILFELDRNSRQSYQEIAKKVGLSKDAVIYRIEKLQKDGVIDGFQTLIDVGKLGFISFRLYLKLQNMTPDKESELIAFFKQQKIVTWIASMEGEYELALWILTKTVAEMNALWKKIHGIYGNYIAKQWLAIFTKVHYYPRVFLLEKKQNFDEFIFITEPDDQKIDDLDTQIVRLMAPNARISILELAKNLKVTPKTISARIKNLEKRKIILGYRSLFSLGKLDQQYFKLFIKTHNVTEQKERQFKEYIKQHPNTIYDNEVLGGEDYEIEIQIGSMAEFRAFLDEIKSAFHSIIENYYYFLIYKEHKFVFFPG